MSALPGERLYRLLPAVYRRRDFDQGEPLRALLGVIEGELEAIEEDIEGLYENWFIETCDEWVVPYIADLLGVPGVAGEGGFVSPRARVANALRFRRRKGTLAVLEHLIRDVTGWSTRAVEYYELLARTQHLGDVRPGKGTIFDLRAKRGPEPPGGPFETAAHTPDLRGIAAGRSRYNLTNLGLFLWRLQSFGIAGTPAHAVANPPDGRYTFSTLGKDQPLFTRPRPAAELDHAAAESDLPGPIGHGALALDLETYRDRHDATPAALRPTHTVYYGSGRSFAIRRGGALVPPWELSAQDLSGWTRPLAGTAVDVRRGRIAFADDQDAGPVEIDYHYGFSAAIGGGPYARDAGLGDPGATDRRFVVAKDGRFETLQSALEAWRGEGKPRAAIRIADSAVYGGAGLSVDLPEDGWLAIEAADGARPCVRPFGKLRLVAPPGSSAAVVLNGLLIEGAIELEGGVELTVTHCTLAPDRVVLSAVEPVTEQGVSRLDIAIDHSILGALRLPAEGAVLAVRDSILGQAAGGSAAIAGPDGGCGPPATLERTTVFGPVLIRELAMASDTIFTAPVSTENRQSGCARFCYVSMGSKTPRRFRCQPDLALADEPADEALVLARVRPRFTSARYGDPAFAQLADDCARELRSGAADGSEMGAFSLLKQEQREEDLRAVLEEYVPVGLEVGLFFVT